MSGRFLTLAMFPVLSPRSKTHRSNTGRERGLCSEGEEKGENVKSNTLKDRSFLRTFPLTFYCRISNLFQTKGRHDFIFPLALEDCTQHSRTKYGDAY